MLDICIDVYIYISRAVAFVKQTQRRENDERRERIKKIAADETIERERESSPRERRKRERKKTRATEPACERKKKKL